MALSLLTVMNVKYILENTVYCVCEFKRVPTFKTGTGQTTGRHTRVRMMSWAWNREARVKSWEIGFDSPQLVEVISVAVNKVPRASVDQRRRLPIDRHFKNGLNVRVLPMTGFGRPFDLRRLGDWLDEDMDTQGGPQRSFPNEFP